MVNSWTHWAHTGSYYKLITASPVRTCIESTHCYQHTTGIHPGGTQVDSRLPSHLKAQPGATQRRRRKKIVNDAYPENDDDAGFEIYRCYCWSAVGYGFKPKLIWYNIKSKNGKMNKTIYLQEVLEAEIST
jgi:hypothetical protein